MMINPRCVCAARGPSVRRSVCYHVFCHYAQQGGQKAIPTGSVPHWLDLKNGRFRKSTAFKSYGVKTVCYRVFCHYAQQSGQKAIPTGSVPHWLDFKSGDFRKSTAFKSYGVKTKRTSQYANKATPSCIPVSGPPPAPIQRERSFGHYINCACANPSHAHFCTRHAWL